VKRDLRQTLLSPRSVAIIGQSNDAGKTAGRPLQYLRRAGYAGTVYPVNPRRSEVLGEPAWPSVAALPDVPEHAFVVTPTEGAVAAVEDCARAGVPVVTVLANGFAEAGPEGLAREARLKEICAQSGIRIVGPSSLGVVNLRDKVLLTANAAFAESDLPAGRIFAASHSGSMIGALVSRGRARGVGFAGLVSVGSEVDLSIGEICAATLDDPGIDGYMLFLETLRKAEALHAFAITAAALGKPVVAFKLGRSAEARELAISHTGALAGEDDVADAFLADCGIARVDTFEGLIEALPLIARVPIRARSGVGPGFPQSGLDAGARAAQVGVVTTTGGGATMVIDRLAASGVHVDGPGAETLARLNAAGIEVAPARLVDLTTAGTRYDVMKASLEILLAAPELDLVLAVVGSSARFHPELAVKPIIDCAGAAKPIAAFLVPEAPQALAALAAANVPSFRTPEACADAIVAALRRREPKPMVGRLASNAGGRMLDEAEAYALLDRIGIPHAPTMLLDTAITRAPALPFSYPVAVKLLSGIVAHKSDVGGVVLGVANGEDLIGAIRQITQRVAERGGSADRVIVQPMVTGVGEALIGYRVDRDVGPLVMVAVGGVLTEIYRDRSLRLAPIDLVEARAMIGEVKALSVLRGYRGRPAGDLDAFARALVALSRLADATDFAVAEAEVNPLIVQPAGQGVIAVDALARLA
jgi:acyl-CoA synthetase (NDP forming)